MYHDAFKHLGSVSVSGDYVWGIAYLCLNCIFCLHVHLFSL
uniref:Uncharacterized protein n=1 Tax=Rhizophora mucronata TaxID=61149 RepID=A0A2P2QP74_RHIMU